MSDTKECCHVCKLPLRHEFREEVKETEAREVIAHDDDGYPYSEVRDVGYIAVYFVLACDNEHAIQKDWAGFWTCADYQLTSAQRAAIRSAKEASRQMS